MPPRTIVSHTALIALLLCGWIFFEALRNNQDNLRLMQLQEQIQSLRTERESAREIAQDKERRVQNATRLANSVGPAILADLAAVSITRRSDAIATLLKKHGIGGDSSTTSPAY